MPRWERWLWIGAAIGMGIVGLVGTLPAWPDSQMPVPLFVTGDLLGIVVLPVLTFLLFRMMWRVRRELAIWKGWWLILLGIAGLLVFMEYVFGGVLLYKLDIGSSARPILLPSVYLLLAIFIAICALIMLGLIVFCIEVALRNLRPRRARAPK